MCLYLYRRANRRRFAYPWREEDRAQVELSVTELRLLLVGSDIVGRVLLSPAPLEERERAMRPIQDTSCLDQLKQAPVLRNAATARLHARLEQLIRENGGCGQERAARPTALFSLLETTKLCGVEPVATARAAPLRALKAPGTPQPPHNLLA